MLAATRILALSLSVVAVTACSPFTEAKLLGTWRSEDKNSVEEWEFDPDQTFTSSFISKGPELPNPSVTVERGEWSLDGHQLKMEARTTNSVRPSPAAKLSIVKMTDGELSGKSIGQTNIVTFKRLNLPVCTATATAGYRVRLLEQNLVGAWQMHYHAYDRQYSFRTDHSVAVSAGAFSAKRQDLGRHMAH
jgi:hypothetical protein